MKRILALVLALAMIASFSTGVVFAIIFTIGFHFANKEEIERKRKNSKKDFLSSK